ncbi:MAG: serine/threonine-protein kinase [Candidatus Melainabacteria bacterium]|nr:serine/threonine-protein kinase [Candidatus Melainabacteria bacterium]
MTDDEFKDREAFKRQGSDQRFAHAEPGIALKVSDLDSKKEITDVVAELTEKPVLASLPAPEMLEQLAVEADEFKLFNDQSLDAETDAEGLRSSGDLKSSEISASDSTANKAESSEANQTPEHSLANLAPGSDRLPGDAESQALTGLPLIYEINKLPLFWTTCALMMLSLTCAPELAVLIAYGYSIFCQYRTSRVVKNLTGARNISPRHVLFVGLIPLYLFVAMLPIGLIGRMIWNSVPQYYGVMWVPVILGALTILYYIYQQWRWPIVSSIALRQYESTRLKKHNEDPAWLVHLFTGVFCNMMPAFLLAFQVMYLVSLAPLTRYLGNMTGHYLSYAMWTIGLIIFQFAGYFFLKRRIREAVVLDAEASALLKRKTKLPVKVSNDDFVVRYRGFAEFERWFKQRFSKPSYKKLFYILAVLFVFIAVGAPQMALKLLTSSPDLMAGGLSASALAMTKDQNLNFLNFFQTFLYVFFGGFGLLYLSKPTHLGFSPKGIRFMWRHAFLEFDGKYASWEQFKQIRLVMPSGKTSPTDQQLLFDANSPKQNVEVKLACVLEVDDKERILKAIEAFAPEVERDATILQTLQPPADHSYTELWLQALTAPPKRERFKPLSEGATLSDGRFRIVSQLGVGGQGTAYLVQDLQENSSVVLKEFILPVYVDVAVRRQALERFENEARILKHLDHDQIVKLIDFFVEDHRSYLVLEHIEGKSLKQIVEVKGPFSEKEVIGLTKQMCTMLHYLHCLSPPVVHRDFTPDNLILRPDGKLKLVDFNVAQQTDSTATGTVVGKHSYLPPEQFRGTPVSQSDLYSLGATLHYLLTGKDPEPISVSRPRRVNPEVSEAMDLFVSRATAMTLEARHQDVAELEKEWTDFFGKSDSLEDGLLDD